MSEKPVKVGNDGFSDIVRADFSNGLVFYRLTNCCGASAKGVEYETHVACRACYQSIDPEFGMAWTARNLHDLMNLLGKTREELMA